MRFGLAQHYGAKRIVNQEIQIPHLVIRKSPIANSGRHAQGRDHHFLEGCRNQRIHRRSVRGFGDLLLNICIPTRCTTEGGMPNDGWSGTQLAGGNGDLFLNPAALGTYAYTVNCVQGSISAQASVTVTVENNPPYATLSVSSSLVAVGQTVSVTYKSNMAGCILDQNLVGTQNQGLYEVSRTGGGSDGTNTYIANNVGASQFTFVCYGESNDGPPAASATPLTVTVQQAAALMPRSPHRRVLSRAHPLR
jgi:hypothetical protein